MKKLLSLGVILAGLVAAPAVSTAQERTLPGPFVHPDHSVTFILNAPDAKSVVLEGNWPGGSAHTSLPMTKNWQGVWSVTTPPIPEDLWSYSFNNDGQRIPDPRNRHNNRNASSLLVVGPPGSQSYNLELHDVPHGTVAQVWYPAPKLKLTSKFAIVYTPAGYENGTARYPVLYLTSDDNNQWVDLSRAPTIIDNLIAEGKAKPMIVVIAATIPDQAAPPSMIDEQLPQTKGLASRFANYPNPHGLMQTLPPYLDGGTSVATDLVPFMDKTYRTIADREHRAIVGVSAPGAAAFYAAMTNPKTFAWVAGFSVGWPSLPGVWDDVPTPKDAATRFPFGGPDIRQNVDIKALGPMIPEMSPASNFQPIYLYQGLNDALIESHYRMKGLLDERGVKYVSIETPNYGHEWRYWSWTLNDWAQRIF